MLCVCVCFSETVAIRISGPRIVQSGCEARASFPGSFPFKEKNVNEVCYCNCPLLKVFNCCLWKFYLQKIKLVFKKCTVYMAFMHKAFSKKGINQYVYDRLHDESLTEP